MPTMEREEQYAAPATIAKLVNEPKIMVLPNGAAGYRIVIETSEEAVAGLVEIVHALLGINTRLHRAVKNTASQEKAEKRVQLLRFQQQGIAKLYYEYRALGYKHRASVKLVAQSQLAEQVKCTEADVNYWRRIYAPPQLEDTHATEPESDHDGLSPARGLAGDAII